MKLKAIGQQTIVITGASSGIGLATARLAAESGANLVIAARSGSELMEEAADLSTPGARVVDVETDVRDSGQMERLAQRAVEEFGGIDTWINDAGTSLYGRALEVPLEHERTLFETNYWGVVHGCRAAVPRLRERGGALINIGSMVSDRAVPLQAAYCASKHAVKGYTDALRMEIEERHWPISVSLVKPAAIATPFFEHAGNYLDEGEPAPPPPVYPPDEVARAILRCATEPIREVTVGGAGRLITFISAVTPRLADVYMERRMFSEQRRGGNGEHGPRALERAEGDRRTHVDYGRPEFRSSLYTRAVLSDVGRALPLVAVGAALGAAVLRARWTDRG